MSCPGAARKGASVSRSDASGDDRTLPRASRLCSRRLFLEVYERGQRARGAHFTVFGLPAATGRSRLGITATKKFGGAVDRNRIKRVVREIFRNNRAAGDLPLDIVVNVNASARGRDYLRLESDLLARLHELRRRFRG